MPTRLQEWAIPHSLHDQPDLLRRARLLTTAVLTILVASLGMIVWYLGRGAPAVGIAVVLYTLISPAPLFVLRWTGRLVPAAHTFCGLLWGIFVVAASLGGGIGSPTVISHVVVVILATLLGGVRTGRLWLIVLIATYFSYEVRFSWGWWVFDVMPEGLKRQTRVAEAVAATTAAFLLCLFYERTKDRMLAEINSAREALRVAHEEARLVLDNAGEGFVTVDSAGHVAGECSFQTKQWFPGVGAGIDFAKVVSKVDAKTGVHFRLALEQLRDGLLPLELILAQFPDQLELKGHTLRFRYRPVLHDGSVSRLVLVISDVSAEVAREKLEALEREYLAVLRRLLKDRAGFFQFIDEIDELLNKLRTPDASKLDQQRWLHTIKGNALVNGLRHIPKLCHDLETYLVQEGRLRQTQLEALQDAWQELMSKFRPLTPSETSTGVSVGQAEYDNLLRGLEQGRSLDDLLHDVRLWTWEPIDIAFRRLADKALALALRLGKEEVEVDWDAHALRVKPDQWRPFFSSLIHLIRNGLDHGLEDITERQAKNKLSPPRLSLTSRVQGQHLLIEVRDNGRGIDWEAVERKARESGVDPSAVSDPAMLIFVDGVSTRDTVTDISGRGVGMGVVLAECRRLSGTVEVVSKPEQGTAFRFSFPLDKVEVERPRLEYGVSQASA